MNKVSSNLDSYFKTDEEAEKKSGVDFAYGPAKFRCLRFGGLNSQNFKAAMAKEYKPFAKQIELNALPEEKDREIAVKVFVKTSLIGWSGVEMNGEKVEFSEENAVKLLLSLPELFASLAVQASDFKNYQADLGNS